MGRFMYPGLNINDVPDGALANLRDVCLERFPDGTGFFIRIDDLRTLWMHPAIAFEFEFDSEERVDGNPEIVSTMLEAVAADMPLPWVNDPNLRVVR